MIFLSIDLEKLLVVQETTGIGSEGWPSVQSMLPILSFKQRFIERNFLFGSF
jgi:hypothetical protein